MKNNTKTYLTSLMIMAATLTACKNQSAEQPTPQEIEKQKREYFEQKRDSVLNAVNYTDLTNEIDALNEQYYRQYSQLQDLKENNTYASILVTEVDTAVSKHLEQTIENINKTYLSVFNVRLHQGRLDYNNPEQEQVSVFEQYCKSEQRYPSVYEYTDFYLDNMAQYGQSRRNEIKNHVQTMLSKASDQAYEIALNIAKKYAKYYPIADIKKYVPAQYQKYFDQKSALVDNCGEGSVAFGANDIKYGRYLGAYRTISLYDSKLKPEFFTDPECTYELKSTKPGKWKVTKTHKNGKVEKTLEFTDNKEWETQTFQNQIPSYLPETKISFEAGANMGVHIYATERIFLVTPEVMNDTLPDPNNERANKITKLNDSINLIKNRESFLYDQRNRFNQIADSIAHQLCAQKFGNQK